MVWIIEESSITEGLDRQLEAIKQAGGESRVLSFDQELNGRYGDTSSGPVIFRGTFEAGRQFSERRPNAKPGVIGNEKSLLCSSYFPSLAQHLLNKDHVFLPLSEIEAKWQELQERFESHSLFIRPDSGSKSFTGQVVDDLNHFLAREKPYLQAMSEDALCLVAKPQEIAAEYRCVIMDGKCVSGCQYRISGEKITLDGLPDTVSKFAQELSVKTNWIDIAYVMDIAVLPSKELKVIEINAFSCADFYALDMLAVALAMLNF